eukprot:Gb_01606 [translate_table: standard]
MFSSVLESVPDKNAMHARKYPDILDMSSEHFGHILTFKLEMCPSSNSFSEDEMPDLVEHRTGIEVLSVTLDDWTHSQVDAMVDVGGNASANAIYEAFLPEYFPKPGPEASFEERSNFIRHKYELQEFVKPSLRMVSPSSSSLSSSFQYKSSSNNLDTIVEQKPSGKMIHTSRLSGLSHAFRKSWRKRETQNKDTKRNLSLLGMVEFLGLLKIKVVKGINLAVRDMMTSDPYVILTIGHQTVKTRVIKSNLNPVWNEELMLSVPNPLQPLKVSSSFIQASHLDISHIGAQGEGGCSMGASLGALEVMHIKRGDRAVLSLHVTISNGGFHNSHPLQGSPLQAPFTSKTI